MAAGSPCEEVRVVGDAVLLQAIKQRLQVVAIKHRALHDRVLCGSRRR